MGFEAIPFSELLSEVIDNRGRTCPTADAGIPLIATNCIRNELLYPTYEKARFVSHETYSTWFRSHPEPDDILFVNKATPGRVCLVPDPVDFCIAQDMVAVRADRKKVHPKYLFAALRSSIVQEQIAQMHVGTLIPHFKKGDFDELLIPVPSSGEQRFIGDVYFDLSAKIDLNRRINVTLERIARATFKSWFVEFGPVRARMEDREPVGMDTETVSLFPDSLLESDLGPIPEGWSVGVLGEVADNFRRQITPSQLEVPKTYIGLEHMPRQSIALGDWATSEGLGSNKFGFERGEILFGKLRPYFHKVGVAPVDGVCSTDILVIAPRTLEWHSFVLGHVSSDELVAHADAASTGTRMPRTNWKDLSSYRLAIPPVDVASAFHELASPIVEAIIRNIHEARNLAAIRDTLLPKLISGEARIRDAERMTEAAL